MADEQLVGEIFNEVVGDLLEDVFANPAVEAYGVAAEVMDDQSTVQAAYAYLADGTAESAPAVRQNFSLVEMRDASRADDGSAWHTVVIKIHRPSGQAALQFIPPADAARWSTDLANDAQLRDMLRPRQEDFEKPIG